MAERLSKLQFCPSSAVNDRFRGTSVRSGNPIRAYVRLAEALAGNQCGISRICALLT